MESYKESGLARKIMQTSRDEALPANSTSVYECVYIYADLAPQKPVFMSLFAQRMSSTCKDIAQKVQFSTTGPNV